ncbi:MAG: hypothetical protein HYR56_07205 [Acidobacteria bacterium]|nr:hypothetical protein [Acidobacteriota bacterium]MBI3426754.1 hypothetical protein [Acidobacteriota bacterium]
MFKAHTGIFSLVLGFLGILSGILCGALFGFFVSMRDTSVHLQTGNFFSNTLWLVGFASKGVLLGAGIGALLMTLAYLFITPDITATSH